MRFFAKTSLFIGILLIAFGSFLMVQRYSPQNLSFENVLETPSVSTGTLPRQIVIKKVKINLPIYPAQIQNNSWQATTSGVSYLISSPIPGMLGNSVLYGHNWTSLLGPLTGVKPGDLVDITYTNGAKKTFKIVYTTVVAPSNTSILDSTGDARITIYTCTGFLDTQRFVAVGKPVSI
ncbi:MAG TPA: sortase [Patescibacteria group bacterium]|nr:sortase [Patescibacteria group bacterium]